MVECVEENISKTNDHATRSISRQPYGKSFRVIITTLVMCFYLCNLLAQRKMTLTLPIMGVVCQRYAI